jgi:hypothetical protein
MSSLTPIKPSNLTPSLPQTSPGDITWASPLPIPTRDLRFEFKMRARPVSASPHQNTVWMQGQSMHEHQGTNLFPPPNPDNSRKRPFEFGEVNKENGRGSDSFPFSIDVESKGTPSALRSQQSSPNVVIPPSKVAPTQTNRSFAPSHKRPPPIHPSLQASLQKANWAKQQQQLHPRQVFPPQISTHKYQQHAISQIE